MTLSDKLWKVSVFSLLAGAASIGVGGYKSYEAGVRLTDFREINSALPNGQKIDSIISRYELQRNIGSGLLVGGYALMAAGAVVFGMLPLIDCAERVPRKK